MKVKSSVESLREIVQDLLVPELKALKVEVTSIHSEVSTVRSEMATGFEAVRIEMRLRDEKQAQAIVHLDDKLTGAIVHLDDKLTGAIKHLDDTLTETTRHLSENIKQRSDKFDSSAEFRERLATLEAKASRG